MDFGFDLDDLGDLGDLEDLEDLDCEWEKLVGDQQGQQQQQQQQQQEHQSQEQPQEAQSSSNSGIFPLHDNNAPSQYQSNGIGTHSQQDSRSLITPGNAVQQSAIDPNADTPHTSNNTNEAFKIRLDREREGRCADCGAQTHEVQFDASGSGRSIKVPLSVPGEVHRGRCLFCHPLPTPHSRQTTNTSPSQSYHHHQQQQAPQSIPQQQGQGHGHDSSSVSVCSQHSSHSIYSQQSSAPLWNGGGQQQFQQQQQVNPNGYGADFVENYQQQNYLQQQHHNPDDTSVYSHASHQSHHSIHSQASYHSYNQLQQQINSPQIHAPTPPNMDTQFNRSNSSNSYSASSSVSQAGATPNDFASAQAAVIIHQQMCQGETSIDTETCLQAMQSFPAHSPIQEKGCAILWARTNNAEICSALSNMGGITVILDSMRNHPQNANLQHSACETVRNLCIHQHNRQVLIQNGGGPLLVEMMRRHVNHPEIQRSGCTALASLAEGGMEFKIAVAECGGILAVMKAVEIHPEKDLVLRAAYQALRMLGYNPGAKNI